MTGAYLRHALVTALRVARFEPNATSEFDHTFEGFFRSFFAVIVSLPLDAFWGTGLNRMLSDAAGSTSAALPGTETSAGLGSILFEAGAYSVGWLAMPLAMIGIVRLIGADRHYVRFVIAYNWGSCVISAAMTVPILIYLSGLATPTGVITLYYAIFVFTVSYRWRLARETLQVSSVNAAAIVIVDVLLSLLIMLVTARLRRGL